MAAGREGQGNHVVRTCPLTSCRSACLAVTANRVGCPSPPTFGIASQAVDPLRRVEVLGHVEAGLDGDLTQPVQGFNQRGVITQVGVRCVRTPA